MPLSETHKRKRAKNYFALVALLAFVAGMFYLSMLKTGGQ